jgi:hypothetical protein
MIMARAQYVPNPLRDVLAPSFRLLVLWLAPSLIDQCIQSRRDRLTSFPRGMLVDHRGGDRITPTTPRSRTRHVGKSPSVATVLDAVSG